MSDAVATFDELVRALSGRPFAGAGTKALSQRAPDGLYVEPLFDVIDDPGDAQVILLSARGAAGKSTTADEISRLTGAPVWRLQDDDTASSSLVELALSRHLRTLEWQSELAQMEGPLLIVDSLDEARARVSASSWSEFVDALKSAVRIGLRLLLLGRTLTLEDVGAQFEGAGVRIAWFEVSHFDSEAQVRYVDVRSGKDHLADGAALGMYEQARDSVLEALRAPLVGGEADKFVGYPPVLEAVVALLREQKNYHAVVKEFEMANPTSRSVVLVDILDAIVAREQEKLAHLAADLDVRPDEIYTKSEQKNWLLHSAEGIDPPRLEHIADAFKRQRYKEETENFRRDHPFLNEGMWASPIFQAYVLASTFDEAPVSLLRAAGNASGMLFDLLSVQKPTRLVIKEAQFAALHASLIAGKQRSVPAVAAVTQEGDLIRGEFVLGGHGSDENLVVGFSLELERTGCIELSGPLANLTVDVSCDVHVSTQRDDVVLGPDLSIRAQNIAVDGVSAAFGGRDSSEGGTDVFLSADGQVTLPAAISPPLPHLTALEIESPTMLAHPWSPYVSKASPEQSSPEVDPRAVRFLDRLMDLTRSHGHRGPRAAYFHKLKGRQALKGEALAAALQVLEQRGVIYRVGDMIFYSESWEDYRYYSKNGDGLSGSGHADVWKPILEDLTKHVLS